MPGVVISGQSGGKEFDAKFTWEVFKCATIAAFGGLMFGYDIGVSGGVSGMDDFLKEFFPLVYVRKHQVKENNYCKYDDQSLQLFTSSLYLAALIASFFAATLCNKYGRRFTMKIASIFFLAGVVLTVVAHQLWILIIGRILLGFGIGCGNQAVPLFISEIAPNKYRGSLNIMFQLLVTVGILLANIVNFFTASIHPHGWRVSLGLAGVPAVMLCLGSWIICETPTSLVEHGKLEAGRSTLKKIRGVEDVDAEFEEIKLACEAGKKVKHPFRNVFKRSSRPQLVISILLQVFQQFTGINAIMFYAPVLFQTVGFGGNGALLSAVITGLVNVFSTLVSVATVDKFGRRALLLEACVQMLISQTAIGVILALKLNLSNTLDPATAILVVFLVCLFVSGFAWSWGPLGWLIPSEIFPIQTRAAGFSFAVSSNMLFTFLIAQAFLSMLCHMRAYIFIFFSAWILIMGIFVSGWLPETKRIPIDEMTERVWKQHWYWKSYMNDDDNEDDGGNVRRLDI